MSLLTSLGSCGPTYTPKTGRLKALPNVSVARLSSLDRPLGSRVGACGMGVAQEFCSSTCAWHPQPGVIEYRVPF